METFEAYLIPGGDVEVNFMECRKTILLDSPKGLDFAVELIDELKRYYPTMLVAVEQKIKRENRSLFAMMRQNTSLYASRMAHTVCGCCFGERDDIPDYDGSRFHMERPDKCRDIKFCPWCGYSGRNRDSFMVICGAKREYGFTPTERRIALLVKKGYVNPSVIAGAMGIAPKSVNNFLTSIYKKTATAGMPELINLIKDENI